MGIFRRPGRSFESGELFKKLCVSAFKQCDVDNSGLIDVKELHIALLILYDKINSIIPVHYDIPDKQEVGSLLRRFDTDKTGELDFDEFHRLARAQMGLNKQDWYKAIWFRVAIKWSLKAVVWPMTGLGAKKGLLALGLPVVGAVPTAAFAYIAEASYKSFAALC